MIDIKEGNDACEFFRNDSTKFDLVIHAAATVGGRMVIDLEPYKLFNNFNLDSELLQWSLKNKPNKVVYFSSSAAYPMHLQQRYMHDSEGTLLNSYRLHEKDIDLNHVDSPDPSIYGWSKLTGEQLVRYASSQDIDIYVFRPFSGYSENQDLDYPFPSFIARAKRRDDPFVIWGDGNQVRDWIHIDDIVEGTLATISQCDPGIWNLCSGRPTSFNEFAEIVTSMVGYKPQIEHKLDAPVGVQYRVGDPTKSHLIYVPRVSLEAGIHRALSIN